MLIVEDGSGLAAAESYASVAFADEYHAGRANDAWAPLETARKEALLRRATEWLGQRFAGRWAGQRVSAEQALDWPRSGVCVDGVSLPADKLPLQLVRATAELALRAHAASLSQDEGAQVVSETVGPISTTYAAGARQQTRYAAVEDMLTPLTNRSGSSIRLVRA